MSRYHSAMDARRTVIGASLALIIGCGDDGGSDGGTGGAGTQGTGGGSDSGGVTSGSGGATDGSGSSGGSGDGTEGSASEGSGGDGDGDSDDSGGESGGGSGGATTGASGTESGTGGTGDGSGTTGGAGTGGTGTTGGVEACYPDNTGTAMADFTGLRVPFFRGEVCTVTEVPPDVDIPVTFKPCLHPCLTPGTHHSKRRNCQDEPCEGFLILWWDETAGTACPPEAFGRFNTASCADGPVVNTLFRPPEVDDMPYEGAFEQIYPFMSNQDIVEVDEHMGSVGEFLDLVYGKMMACEPTPDRRIVVDVAAGHPMPPANCEDDPACTCFPVGYAP